MPITCQAYNYLQDLFIYLDMCECGIITTTASDLYKYRLILIFYIIIEPKCRSMMHEIAERAKEVKILKEKYLYRDR